MSRVFSGPSVGRAQDDTEYPGHIGTWFKESKETPTQRVRHFTPVIMVVVVSVKHLIFLSTTFHISSRRGVSLPSDAEAIRTLCGQETVTLWAQ